MEFTIYSKPDCSFCEQAKALLKSKNIPFNEMIIDVGQVKDPAKTYTTTQSLLAILPSARTIPQIFRGEEHIGGYAALKKLVESTSLI